MVSSLQLPKSDPKSKQIHSHCPAQRVQHRLVSVFMFLSCRSKQESWRALHREGLFICGPGVAGAGNSGSMRESSPGDGLEWGVGPTDK